MTPGKSSVHIQLQDRDLALLRGLFESRLMTLDHAAELHFGGKREYAKKRVQRLKVAGYLTERPRRAYDPSILHLTVRSLELLRGEGLLDGFPRLSGVALRKRAQVSDITLRHERAVMDVKVAFSKAIKAAPGLAIEAFSTWPKLNEFAAIAPAGESVTVKPDAFVRIAESDDDDGAEHAFYLEVDRSTEVLETLASRAACYLDHYRSGGLAVKFGDPRDAYREHPFRVLFVLQSEARRDNLALRLLRNRPPILRLAWVTTFAEVIAEPLGAIWLAPGDYADSTDGKVRAKRRLFEETA